MVKCQTSKTEIELDALRKWSQEVYEAFTKVSMKVLIDSPGKAAFVSDALSPLTQIIDRGMQQNLVGPDKRKERKL